MALVIAQPILEELRVSALVLTSTGARGAAAILLPLLLITVPAAALLAAEATVGAIFPPARKWAHRIFTGALIGVFAWQVAVEVGIIRESLRGLIFASATAIAIAAQTRFRETSTLLRYLGFAAPVVLLLFVLRPPASKLFGTDEVELQGPPPGPPVVMVVFDELPLASLMTPGGRIDRAMYPNFARLAASSTWYRGARAAADQTVRAVPALLGGELPPLDGVPTAADNPENLIAWLSTSYDVVAFEAETDLCPREVCPARRSTAGQVVDLARLGASAANPLPGSIAQRITARLAPDATEAPDPLPGLAEFVRTIKPTQDATFWFAHPLLPHGPWRYLPDGTGYVGPEQPGAVGLVFSEPHWAREAQQRHLLQVLLADRELGRILAALKRAGHYKESLIAVVADHGASFLSGYSMRSLSSENAGGILPVPLLVKAPMQSRARTSDTPVRTTIVPDLIARALGWESPWGIGHRLPSDPAQPARYVRFGHGPLEISGDTIEDQLARAIADRKRFFPNRRTIYAAGGRAGTIGIPVARLGGPLRISLDDPAALEADEPSDSVVPAYVSGTVEGYGGPPGAPVAVGLGGRVVATTTLVAEDAVTRFSAVLPARAFETESAPHLSIHLLPIEAPSPRGTYAQEFSR